MRMTFEANVSGTPPTPPASPAHGYPQPGNSLTSTPATKEGPWWPYMMTMEVQNVITAAGLTPDHTNVTQLAQAIAILVSNASKAVVITAVTFNAGVSNGQPVYWDSANSRFDKAQADGTAKQNCVGFADVTNSKLYAFGDATLWSATLTAGARYYLSDTTAGGLTTVAPTTNVVQVGIAKTTSEMFIDVDVVPASASVGHVPVRQTVLRGPANSGGTPNLGGSTGSTSVTTSNISTGASALIATSGGGFGSTGEVNYIGQATSNLTFSGLSTNGVMYGYADINTSTGAMTAGTGTLAPIYTYGGTPSTTNGQYTYNITEGQGYLGNGSSAVASTRVYLGEFDVASNVVSAIRWYAYCGRYDSGWFAITNNNTYSKAANLGVQADVLRAYMSKNSNGFPQFNAVWNPDSDGARANGILLQQTDACVVVMKVDSTSIAAGSNSAYLADVPNTSGYGRVVAERGW